MPASGRPSLVVLAHLDEGLRDDVGLGAAWARRRHAGWRSGRNSRTPWPCPARRPRRSRTSGRAATAPSDRRPPPRPGARRSGRRWRCRRRRRRWRWPSPAPHRSRVPSAGGARRSAAARRPAARGGASCASAGAARSSSRNTLTEMRAEAPLDIRILLLLALGAGVGQRAVARRPHELGILPDGARAVLGLARRPARLAPGEFFVARR